MKIILSWISLFWVFAMWTTIVYGMPSFEDALLSIDKGQIQQALEIAYQLEMNEDYENALTILDVLLEKYSHNRERVNIMIEKAAIYEKQRIFEEAIDQYRTITDLDPSTYEDHPYFSYADFSRLRIDYLTSEPTWSRPSREELLSELTCAFSFRNLEHVSSLLKKGDCYIGSMYSEPFLTDPESLFLYLKSSFNNSNWKVNKPVEIWENQWAIEITNWTDSHWPDHDLLYLIVKVGLFGWEWGEIIFSKSVWNGE
ncbi:MAG TPA: hypothetical protein DCY12_04695 [Candidatus Atribacteria bacterium]|nr:hypothetical protein [Candidatus Atribacteria bacterium]